MPTEGLETPRIARACVNCNKKKIRCKFEHAQRMCDSCANLGIDCIARTRKKRKVASRQESPFAGVVDAQPESYQYWGPGRTAWPGGNDGRTFPRSSSSRLEDRSSWPSPGNSIFQAGKQTHEQVFTAQFTAPIPRQVDATVGPNTYHDAMGDVRSVMHSRRDDLHGFLGAELGPIAPEKEENALKSRKLSQDISNEGFGLQANRKARRDELSDIGLKTLQLHGSLELPLRAARQSLIDTYMQKCYPWTPILAPEELDNSGERLPSLLLCQSIFLAASRVSSAAGGAMYASPEQFYQRAKALFWTDHETDPFTVIKSAINLHWHQPSGPDRSLYDNSTLWLQIAVGIARQVDLHKEPAKRFNQRSCRRLWWSLVARDCLVAAAEGCPRSTNFKDSDMQPPCLEDFPREVGQGELFISFVEISILLADLTECLARKHISQNKQLHTERALFRWSKTLAPQLQLCSKDEVSGRYILAGYDVKARQLHVPYFIIIVLLGRSHLKHTTVPSMSILAASFVAGIFDDFVARGELLSLGPTFAFYLLAAGITLAPLHRYPDLWPAAEQDLETIQHSLKELTRRFPSASSALSALLGEMRHSQQMHDNITTFPQPLARLDPGQRILFDGFCPDICRMWAPYHKATGSFPTQPSGEENPEIITAEILGSMRYPSTTRTSRVTTPMAAYNNLTNEKNTSMVHNDAGIGIGEWLLKNRDTAQ